MFNSVQFYFSLANIKCFWGLIFFWTHGSILHYITSHYTQIDIDPNTTWIWPTG